VDGQRDTPAALTPWKTRYPLYRRLGEPQGRCWPVRKISPPPGFDPGHFESCAVFNISLQLPPVCLLPPFFPFLHLACRLATWQLDPGGQSARSKFVIFREDNADVFSVYKFKKKRKDAKSQPNQLKSNAIKSYCIGL